VLFHQNPHCCDGWPNTGALRQVAGCVLIFGKRAKMDLRRIREEIQKQVFKINDLILHRLKKSKTATDFRQLPPRRQISGITSTA
jgi:hypothetical protein